MALWLPKAKRWAINAFLVFHLLAITCWCLPINNAVVSMCRAVAGPYFRWSGLFQSWDMFAPMPKLANTRVEAIVEYRDGSTELWAFPRMEELGLLEKVSKERYRKFAENLQREENDPLLPDVARHIARLKSTPGKPVKMVVLVQEWSGIVLRSDGSYEPGPWQQHVLLGYGVRSEDLK